MNVQKKDPATNIRYLGKILLADLATEVTDSWLKRTDNDFAGFSALTLATNDVLLGEKWADGEKFILSIQDIIDLVTPSGGAGINSKVGVTLGTADNTATETTILTLDDIALADGDMIMVNCVMRMETPAVGGGFGKSLLYINGDKVLETDSFGTYPHAENPGYLYEFYHNIEIYRDGDYLRLVHNRSGKNGKYGHNQGGVTAIEAFAYSEDLYENMTMFVEDSGLSYDYETEVGWATELNFEFRWKWDDALTGRITKMIMGRAEKKELDVQWNY